MKRRVYREHIAQYTWVLNRNAEFNFCVFNFHSMALYSLRS